MNEIYVEALTLGLYGRVEYLVSRINQKLKEYETPKAKVILNFTHLDPKKMPEKIEGLSSFRILVLHGEPAVEKAYSLISREDLRKILILSPTQELSDKALTLEMNFVGTKVVVCDPWSDEAYEQAAKIVKEFAFECAGVPNVRNFEFV